ncbi:spindle and centriole-associated protein 1 isoform X1 [Centroberyx affinis]|uniref:spindle and centriole-associated protein 1 isoform X1 n=1 Tax=Centroberyx affinis TaxID=166261 RepID=UPI003A5C2F12
MSFVRTGRSQHTQGKRPVRPKKAGAPKREWVSTVNDLSVHKLTPEELTHRHEIHKSHNKAVAQWELKEKALRRHLRHPGSPAPLDRASLSIIREVFSDQFLLQDVLARSDRAMAVVKDLFGDAPRRQTGHPSVTMAPNCDSDSALPVVQRPDPPTQLSLLSQSMMDQQALNELEASEEDHSDEDTCPTASSDYHVVHRANLRKMKVKARGRGVQQQRVHPNSRHQGERDGVPVTPCTSGRAPNQAALNATVAVERLRSRQSQSEEGKEEHSTLVTQVLNPETTLNQSGRNTSHPSRTRKGRAECVSQSSGLDGSTVSALSGDQSSLGLLQAMLGQVEAELDSLSPETVPTSPRGPQQHKTQGLTGFSVALVSTLGRLVHLLRQREEEAQLEAQERRRLEEEVKEQRGLIDALTAETMALREESAALQAGLQQRTAELEQRLDTVVLALGGLGLLGTQRDCGPQDCDIRATVCQTGPFPEQDPERTQAPVSPAVLLSPPRQGDNWQHSPVFRPVPLHQELPPLDTMRSREDVQARSPAASLSSLPLTSLPSTSSLSLTSDPLGSQLSQEAILSEITQFTRQNDLIRAQLSQAKGVGSGARGSSNSSSERRGSCSSSTGRATPQSAGERRMSGSSSTGRGTQHAQAAEREHLTQQDLCLCLLAQAAMHNTPSVEQRLLELNRQSAAARSRLLELIEQQKLSASGRVSPSVSPIPPSAFSPHTAGGGGTPEASMLLPAQDPLSQASGGGRRSASGEMSSQSLGGETRDGKTQADKLRERDGWFALSTHVR